MAVRVLAVALCGFTLAEVNYPNLLPQTQLAIFAFLGLALCFLQFPAAERLRDARWAGALDGAWVAAAALACGWIVVQGEPAFRGLWVGGQSLGNRAGAETAPDYVVGAIGILVILEAARRVVGWALPSLALTFLAYAMLGPWMPSWLFPHRGYGVERLVAQSFLQSQGVFGIALRVMFTYVFLFVVFGALLEATGATRFIIDAARRAFGGGAGAPAKVAILSSGLMGSLSGSAVANTATTGTFTIPLMRSAGFRPHVAAGIEAAASSGGALVPPVMGAGAYMMLEIISPPVTYLQIIRAALLPALLYYFALFLIAHFMAGRMEFLRQGTAPPGGETEPELDAAPGPPAGALSGWIFAASLGTLVALLIAGFTVFRAVSLAMAVVIGISLFSASIRLTPSRLLGSLVRAARGGIPLVAAAACVGIVLGVVTLTGVGSKLPATILPLAQHNLFLALVLIMVSSIVLGMGLPSAVCYLLLATLIGPALDGLGVVPLAAHLFIFYFGLMSMVTPPVALAAYTAASIAGSGIMATALASFRFALVGFALPFLFVFRPQLLMLAPSGDLASAPAIAVAFLFTAAGTVPFAAGLTGFLRRPLGTIERAGMFVAAALLFMPPGGGWAGLPMGIFDVAGAVLLGALLVICRPRRGDRAATGA
ncbi:MAG: TRAP transporter fused permease subunit [Acidobacteriota bacterium]